MIDAQSSNYLTSAGALYSAQAQHPYFSLARLEEVYFSTLQLLMHELKHMYATLT